MLRPWSLFPPSYRWTIRRELPLTYKEALRRGKVIKKFDPDEGT